jgi:putative phage-type endonuclease
MFYPIVKSLIDKYGITDIYGNEKKDISEIQQRSKAWYKERYNMISSSNASAVLGMNKYMSREDLFNEKIQSFDDYYKSIMPKIQKDLNSITSKNSVSNPIDWGIKYEPFAKYIYEKINNTFVYDFGIIKHSNPLYYWLGASPDGITKDGRLLEIKCLWNRKNNENIPILPYIWVQTQIQMEVTNLNECDLFECKFIEYSSIEEYENDNGSNVIELENYYTDSSDDDMINNKINSNRFTNNLLFLINRHRRKSVYKNIQFKGYDEISDTYWKLESYVCRTIKRDKDWFDTFAYPKLMMFWKEVEKERENKQKNIRMTVKRKLKIVSDSSSVNSNNQDIKKNKKRRTNNIIEKKDIVYTKYITENNISNYIQNDTLVDWLYKFGNEKYAISHKLDKLNQFMKKRHFNYKIYIYNKLVHLFSNKIVKVILNKNRNFIKKDINETTYLLLSDIIKYPVLVDKYINDTKDALKQYPIICNSLLVNNEKGNIFQYDILIRGDYMNILFKDVLDKKILRNILLKDRYKYFIIKILNTPIKYKKDKITIQNSSNKIKIKKAQAIYSNIYIDNEFINKNFIFMIPYEIFNMTNDDTLSIFNNYGVIDVYGKDFKLVSKIDEAIKWWKKLCRYGHSWKLNPPSVPELYPNMKNTSNTDWLNVKNKIAKDIGEITDLWGCSLDDRKLLNKNGIYSWKDKKFNINYLKNNNDKKKFIINSMIELNNTNIKNDIKNKRIIYNKDKLKSFKDDIIQPDNNSTSTLRSSSIDFFIDFETINNIDGNNLISDININDMINIIGVGYIHSETNEWVFKSFIANRLTFDEEKRIINEWINYMDDIVNEYNIISDNKSSNKYKCRVYHWSQAEFNMIKRFIQKLDPNNIQDDKKIISNIHKIFYDYKWVDLLHIFKNIPIIIKGALNFSLKTVSKALYNLNEIDILWDDNSCINGLESMFISLDANVWAINKNKNIKQYYGMIDVIKYNEIDCKVMWKILLFLQKLYLKS